MNIAESFRSIKPVIVKKVEPLSVSNETLTAVFNAISNGFNMTNNHISKITCLSIGCASRYRKHLYNLGHLSRINIMDGQKGYCWAYTVIKPLRGKL